MRKFIILLLLLTVLFISSGQTYEQQSIIPNLQKLLPGKPFETVLSKLEIPYWGITVSVEERGYYYFIEFLLRKSAHFFIFGFIAASIYTLLPKMSFRFLLAALFTLFIAIGDEYRQSLTGGRTPSIQDVMLDMAGALTTLIIVRLIMNIINRLKGRKRRRKIST
ncbi:VanZ family protein [Sporosarcina pasteurii]|uniref:Predicted integral membrane protein n=1 Tax=Sporosarcina pasteurii TaxID=1474 RepID=A0A380BFY7_SPOPA|nr:VanZ family protein [Sporosarcina pasteurii]MDS9472444.1 VanZ family protein [Sporosarcina pasteurii]QBQ06002.1 VanZ family protein [Sporosarcina pasteurii]SUI99694.1 Predicted integral membrane protein [Sporosarcina pasteurii]